MKVNKTEPPLCDTETDKEPINEREFNFKSTIYDRELYLSLSDKSAEIQNKPEEDILEVTEVKPDNNDQQRQFTLPDNAKAPGYFWRKNFSTFDGPMRPSMALFPNDIEIHGQHKITEPILETSSKKTDKDLYMKIDPNKNLLIPFMTVFDGFISVVEGGDFNEEEIDEFAKHENSKLTVFYAYGMHVESDSYTVNHFYSKLGLKKTGA